ncbi:TadE/TadG family type IV pilus assembly protein [Sphingomonas sp. TREG-RG-20F-R18-01]|uniref:TadE/TadG family type IV pilus assembly protein n=1 Tax=Sphingomonas sp. TREG-RG-20F-R18-01 TaxID=2914982 RepID=UPI001F56FF42|nr:TadE/TadG family type IV pilus assembly protein [Sphingomonas sp. TREG-RG-20F-R18-01]
MTGQAPRNAAAQRGLLASLARDVRGNTLAMMAIFLIPLTGLVGSAVDMSRLYVVKARLQQACDAGALAGRKFMIDSNSTTLDANANTQAQAFFGNNFKKDTTSPVAPGYMGTTAVTFTPAKTADNQVSGSASATVPMTVSQILGTKSVVISVTCEARYDVADTDVMFVLDTTGSMACLPSDTDSACTSYVSANATTAYTRPADSALGASNGTTGSANDSVAGYPGSTGYAVPERSGSRIAAVRSAVVSFYTTIASNADPSTHVRYGFVTYTSTVNAGAAIMDVNPSFMIGGAGTSGAKTWTYNSRYIDPNKTSQYQVSQSSVYDSTSQSNCSGSVRTPAAVTGQPYTFDTSSRATVVGKAWNSAQSGSNKCLVTTTTYGPLWTYGPTPLDVSSYLTNTSIIDPSKLDGTTNSWAGCIEERDTTSGVSSFNVNALPGDLDPDRVPTSDATRWRPMWSEVVYARNYNGGSPSPFFSTSSVMDSSNNGGDTDKTAFYNNVNGFSYFYYGSGSLLKGGLISCGKPVRRVSTMTQQDVTNYVNATDFRPVGGTYHDTGMIWGVRLLSPTGVFSGDTAAWPGRQSPNRVIVFLTDGDMAPSTSIYGMYGIEGLDKRVTNGDFANQKNYHNQRFLAECAKAKALNIDVWTVSITTDATPTAEMTSCAKVPGQALVTASGSGLQTAFQNIAKQVAMLRISK